MKRLLFTCLPLFFAGFALSSAAIANNDDIVELSIQSPPISDQELIALQDQAEPAYIYDEEAPLATLSKQRAAASSDPQGMVVAVFCCRKGSAYSTRGSGTLVPQSDKGFVLLTARHVLHNDGDRLVSAYFSPSRKGQSLPFGKYGVSKVYLYKSKKLSLDIAFAKLDKPKGVPFPGTTPVSFNFADEPARGKNVATYGYTGGEPYKQKCMKKIKGRNSRYGMPQVMYVRLCDNMGRGASGGGWIYKGKVVGFNSFMAYSDRWHMFSPTLGEKARLLYSRL